MSLICGIYRRIFGIDRTGGFVDTGGTSSYNFYKILYELIA